MKKMQFSRIVACVSITALLVVGLLLSGCAGKSASSSNKNTAPAQNSSVSKAPLNPSELGPSTTVEVTVKGYDPFQIKVFTDQAPKTAENFLTLVNEGYYNGKTFYRVVKDFCLQGGTLGNNAAGNDPSLTPIKGEFAINGAKNTLADNFGKGVVAMARTSDPNSATSTFFITLGSSSSVSASLNGQYAAFGLIDDAGMKIVDSIVQNSLKKVDEPTMGAISKEADQPVIESMKVVL